MKHYTVPMGRMADYQHPAPERTAYRLTGWQGISDAYCQVWSNRAAMARSIRMQERAAPSSEWRPIVKLSIGEGY